MGHFVSPRAIGLVCFNLVVLEMFTMSFPFFLLSIMYVGYLMSICEMFSINLLIL